MSKAVSLIDGKRMPEWLEIEALTEVLDRNQPPSWGARIELQDGTPKIVSMGFFSFNFQREVKAADFQRFRSVIYVFYSAFCSDIGPDGEPGVGEGLGEPVKRTSTAEDKQIAEFLEGRRTGRRRMKTDDYKRAAQVYRDNFDSTPTQAVADAFHVGLRQGGNIVAECRRRGFLSNTTKQGKKQI